VFLLGVSVRVLGEIARDFFTFFCGFVQEVEGKGLLLCKGLQPLVGRCLVDVSVLLEF
jgi:hypothetical protein